MNKHLENPWVQPELDIELREIYVKLGYLKEFKKGDYINKCGDSARHVYLIVEGACSYEYVSYNGAIRQLGILFADASFGEYPNILKTSRELNVKVIEDSKILIVSYSNLENEVYSKPELAIKFTKHVCDKNNHFLEVYHHLTDSNTFMRFFVYLRSMVKYYHAQTDSEGFYTIPFKETKERLAESVGCTRVTFSRMMKYLVDHCYVTIVKKSHIKFRIDVIDDDFIEEHFGDVKWKGF